MIARLAGRLHRKAPESLVVDVNGVGYQVFVSLNAFAALPAEGDPVELAIHTQVRENAFELFGFLEPTEKALFAALLGVSGVGPRMALNILSGLPTRALIDALRELAENTTRAKGVATEFSMTGRPQSSSADAEMQLLRIAQESVNNAVRHGRATQVRINLHFEDDRIRLRISDDGRGFVPDEHEAAPDTGHHLGLLTMRERAARVRGRIDIISSPGRGTTIETSVPVMAE